MPSSAAFFSIPSKTNVLSFLKTEQNTREPSSLQQASILLQLAKLSVEETIPQTEPFIDPETGDWILKNTILNV